MWVELFRLLITDANRLSLYIYEVRPRSDTLARPPSLILFSLDPSLIVQLTTVLAFTGICSTADNARNAGISPTRWLSPPGGCSLKAPPTSCEMHRTDRVE
jgi:hypothetical protein